MKVAKVIGNIWATRKEEKLAGYKLLIVQPINILDGSKDKTPMVAADIIGAGVGETVLIVGGARPGARPGTCRSLLTPPLWASWTTRRLIPAFWSNSRSAPPGRHTAKGSKAVKA